MELIPAIDLLGGRVVRLRRGRYEDVTVYRDDAVAAALELVELGATRIHVVDLEAARSGPAQTGELDRITAALDGRARLQVGGGLRTLAALAQRISAGADRVVLGTAAIRDEALVRDACARWPDRIVVAVDARADRVAIDGWTEATSTTPEELARRAASWGAAAVLFTVISRDGTGAGPDVEATLRLARAVPVPVLASGGVHDLAHVRALAAAPPIAGVVVGRAIYERTLDLPEALAIAAGGSS